MFIAALRHQIEVVYTRLDPNMPEDTSKLHKEVTQMPVVSTSIILPFHSQSAPLASWGVPYEQLSGEEKSFTLCTDGSA